MFVGIAELTVRSFSFSLTSANLFSTILWKSAIPLAACGLLNSVAPCVTLSDKIHGFFLHVTHVLIFSKRVCIEMSFQRGKTIMALCQDHIPFVLFWHSKFNGIGKILHDNFNKMITDHPALKEVFPQPSLFSYCKNRNLRNISVHSSIASEPRSHDRFQITEPCNHPSCLTCHSMSKTRHIINHCNKRRAPNAGGNCSTSNVVYGAECLKHKQLYVGYTNRPVHVRFSNHRSDIVGIAELTVRSFSFSLTSANLFSTILWKSAIPLAACDSSANLRTR